MEINDQGQCKIYRRRLEFSGTSPSDWRNTVVAPLYWDPKYCYWEKYCQGSLSSGERSERASTGSSSTLLQPDSAGPLLFLPHQTCGPTGSLPEQQESVLATFVQQGPQCPLLWEQYKWAGRLAHRKVNCLRLFRKEILSSDLLHTGQPGSVAQIIIIYLL